MKFNQDIADRYLGQIHSSQLAYAASPDVREGAASGGVTSAILLHLLKTGLIDGAIVTRLVIADGKIGCEVALATTAEEILQAQRSKYMHAPVVGEGAKLIRQFTGRVAVVGLPCQIAAFTRLAETDPAMAGKIHYKIALFCNHNTQRDLLDGVLAAKGIDQSQIVEFVFRKGRWRGRMAGTMRDGSTFSFPSKHFLMYHNLHMFCEPFCMSCHDHLGYDSDFSCGDAWLREMKREPIKHSVIVARNERAQAVLDAMQADGELVAKPIDAKTVFRSQKRSLIYHYNVSARAKVGRRYGLRIKDDVHAPVRWNDWLAAHIIMINHRISHDRRRRHRLFKMPRPLMFGYMLVLKLLQNF